MKPVPSILVVDDEAGLRRLLETIFHRAGYAVFLAEDGSDGLTALYHHRPDIVILDDSLPNTSGAVLCSRIKNDPDLSDTKVIIFSADSVGYHREYRKTCQADGFLPKPSLPNEILRKIQEVY